MGRKKKTRPSQRVRTGESAKTSKVDPAAMRAVFDGSLTLAQAGQVSAGELDAIAQQAERTRRAGDLQGSLGLYQVLTLFDPYEPRWWASAAGLHQRIGQFAPALGAYQMVEVLGGSDAEIASRSANCEQQLYAALAASA